MAVDSIPVAAYRFMADGAQAIDTNKKVRDGLTDINNVKLDKVDTSIGSLLGSVSRLLPALSAAGLAGFAVSAVRAADAMGDAAERNELSISSFSRLNYIAQQTDIEFSELTTSLRQYRLGLADAERGEGELRQALDQLHLSAADLIDLPIEDQLGLIADRFSEVDDTATRTRLATDLFKRSGQAMLPLLSQGSDGIRQLAEDADRYSQVLDERAVGAIDRFTKGIGTMVSAAKTATANAAGNLLFNLFGTGDEIRDIELQIANLIERRNELQANPTLFGQAGLAELATANQQLDALNQKLATLKATAAASAPDDRMNLLPLPWLDPVQEFTPSAQKIAEEDEYDKVMREYRERRLQEEQEWNDARIAQQEQLGELTIQTQQDIERQISEDLFQELTRRHEYEEWARERTRTRELELQQTIIDFRRQGTLAAQTLLTAYGGKYASIAKAILAVEKAHAIAKTIISTKAAAAAALEYYGPTPWGYAAAAGAIVYGAAQVAAIASTVIGGGSSSVGSPHNPVYVEPGAGSSDSDTGSGGTPAAAEQRAISIIVNGNIYSGKETVDFLMEQLRQRINEYDAVIIHPTSRQARELVPEQTT